MGAYDLEIYWLAKTMSRLEPHVLQKKYPS